MSTLRVRLSHLVGRNSNARYSALPGAGPLDRRRTLRSRKIAVAVVLAAVGLFSLTWLSSALSGTEVDDEAAQFTNHTLIREHPEEWEPPSVLEGPPTIKFRDNLRSEKKYITTWIASGWTNDVMSYINLIYLGILTERVPVIPTFATTHGVGADIPRVRFSDVFDLPRLQRALKMSIIEWGDVKQNTSIEVDEIGCWSTWGGLHPQSVGTRPNSYIPHWLKLDVSYTPAPTWVNLDPSGSDTWGSFSAFASLTFPEQMKEYAVEPLESEEQQLKLPPDEHMVCFDQMYYVASLAPFEYTHDYSPAWRFVGKYLHWTARLQGLGDQYVRKTLGVADGEKTPTWISIHARHGDFRLACQEHNIAIDECFPPLSVVSKRVEEVKKELLDRKGIVVDSVIMLSDEEDSTWWAEVQALGWHQVDHSETEEKYGSWYPVLIDAVIQSGGMGFVGTEWSTMSVIAQRRVKAWHDGATRMIKFIWNTDQN